MLLEEQRITQFGIVFALDVGLNYLEFCIDH